MSVGRGPPEPPPDVDRIGDRAATGRAEWAESVAGPCRFCMSARRPRLLARAGARARPRPARLEAGARARPPSRSLAARCAPTTTRSAIRRTRSSSATSRPEALWEIERPVVAASGRGEARRARSASSSRRPSSTGAWRRPTSSSSSGWTGASRATARSPIYEDGEPSSASMLARARSRREPLGRASCSRTSRARRPGRSRSSTCSRRPASRPDELEYAIGCGEEAVGDRYQRGGGNLGKAIAEQAGCSNASGSDVKAFCAGPIHALVVAGVARLGGRLPTTSPSSPAGRSPSSG